MDQRTNCTQCGTCCRKGGPALHVEDAELIRKGCLGYHQLVTIRKGEPVFSPLSGRLEPARVEFIKISGKGKEWTCLFFDEKYSVCTIYKNRPLECRLLKCWDEKELVAVINKDTLSRRDVINRDDPVLLAIAEHDRECPGEMLGEIISCSRPGEGKAISRLTEAVQSDLALRGRAVEKFGLSLGLEFFVFGRPLFKQLEALGLVVEERQGSIHLHWDGQQACEEISAL